MTELEEKLLQFIANLYRMNEIAPNQLSGMLDDYRCVIESYGYNQEVKKKPNLILVKL